MSVMGECVIVMVKVSNLVFEKDVVYYESIKREVQIRPLQECRCDERLKTKVEESTYLTYTGLHGELEHLKIKSSLL